MILAKFICLGDIFAIIDNIKIIIMRQQRVDVEDQLGNRLQQLMFSALVIALFLLIVWLAAPVAAQAETSQMTSAQAEETPAPGTSNEQELDNAIDPTSSNGHEVDNLADPVDTGAGEIAVDPEVGGIRLSLVLFIVGSGTILVFVVIFLQKFILHKP